MCILLLVYCELLPVWILWSFCYCFGIWTLVNHVHMLFTQVNGLMPQMLLFIFNSELCLALSCVYISSVAAAYFILFTVYMHYMVCTRSPFIIWAACSSLPPCSILCCLLIDLWESFSGKHSQKWACWILDQWTFIIVEAGGWILVIRGSLNSFCLKISILRRCWCFFKGNTPLRLLKQWDVPTAQEIAIGLLGIPCLGQEAQVTQYWSSTISGYFHWSRGRKWRSACSC